MKYQPEELDILSRAYHGAIECISFPRRDAEAVKAALMRGLLDAASLGEWDEERLKATALRSIRLYHAGRLQPAMRTAAL
jgi:hypothetical protein